MGCSCSLEWARGLGEFDLGSRSVCARKLDRSGTASRAAAKLRVRLRLRSACTVGVLGTNSQRAYVVSEQRLCHRQSKHRHSSTDYVQPAGTPETSAWPPGSEKVILLVS